MRTAIHIKTGYSQPDYWSEGCGLYGIKDKLRAQLRDACETWIGIRPWRGPHEHDAKEIVRHNPAFIISLDYSWGDGYGLVKFAEALKELGRNIDLACLIDPVPYVVARWLSSALLKGNGLFDLPENVTHYASWRTLNKPSITTPWGRDVYHKTALPLHRRAFGTKELLDEYKPAGLHTIDAEVNHSTIDNHPLVCAEVLEVVSKFIGTDVGATC